MLAASPSLGPFRLVPLPPSRRLRSNNDPVTTHLHVTAKRSYSKEEATSRTGKVSRYVILIKRAVESDRARGGGLGRRCSRDNPSGTYGPHLESQPRQANYT